MKTLGLVAVLALSGSVAAAEGFYTVTPCRFVDTRQDIFGPPESGMHVFRLQGSCDVPLGAQTAVLNVTVAEATVPGHVVAFSTRDTINVSGNSIIPRASTLAFHPGRTPSALTFVQLGPVTPGGGEGDLIVYLHAPSGSAQIILDVVGYFR